MTITPKSSAKVAVSPGADVVPLARANRMDFLWKVIGRYDAYITSTVQRGTAIVALSAVVVGSIVLKYPDFLNGLSSHTTLRTLAGIAIVTASTATLLSFWFTFSAIVPMYEPPSDSGTRYSMVYFSDVADQKKDKFLKDVLQLGEETAVEDLAGQAHILASLTRTKYVHMRRAFWVIKYGLVSSLVALFVIKLLAIVLDMGKS